VAPQKLARAAALGSLCAAARRGRSRCRRPSTAIPRTAAADVAAAPRGTSLLLGGFAVANSRLGLAKLEHAAAGGRSSPTSRATA
jgi:hypothetical protein